MKKRWLLAIALILAVGLSYAVYSLFIHSKVDYFTVSELKLQAGYLYEQPVRVGGKVMPGSINWDDKTKVMRFLLSDDRESLTITHKGIVPDDFKPGAEVVLEGKYRPDNIFESLSFGSRRSVCNLCH